MKNILFIINQDWYFCLHWNDRAIALRDEGYNVIVAVPAGQKIKNIERSGFEVLPIDITRSGISPLKELRSIYALFLKIRIIMPNLIVNVTVKPNLYGTIIGKILNIPVINNVTGLGTLFSRKNWIYTLIRTFILFLFSIFGKSEKTCFIFENIDDQKRLISKRIIQKTQAFLMPGAGVDTTIFNPKHNTKKDKCIILFAARLLYDKGIETLIESSKELKEKNIDYEIWVAGIFDEGNRNCVPESYLIKSEKRGLIKWIGKSDDMPELLAKVHIVTLPTTYGEGIPRILIEAASCCKPVVTTNIAGCREFVENGRNGFLVPPKNTKELTLALEKLIKDEKLRNTMGIYGRQKVCAKYSQNVVIEKTLKIYKDMMK